MRKIISAKELIELEDAFVEEKGILPYELMEAAAEAFCQWYTANFDRKQSVIIFCGMGNNGGDGLAAARILFRQGYPIDVCLVGDLEKASQDFQSNLKILPTNIRNKKFSEIKNSTLECQVVIDALFGFGLNRPVEGEFKEAINYINKHKKLLRISIDLPSGLPADGLLEGVAVESDRTISFHYPKLSLLFPEHSPYVGELVVLDIGIDKKYFDKYSSKRYFLEKDDIVSRHKKFHRASHKGDYGKVLMVGGSKGKLGAIMLTSRAALRSGSGLVSAYIPNFGTEPFHAQVPEVMLELSSGVDYLEGLDADLDRYDAIGVGPGMGEKPETVDMLIQLFSQYKGKMIIDADALNIIATNDELKDLIRPNMILTPHLKEFERMVGKVNSHDIRIEKARSFASKYGCILILKGANTMIALPDGTQYFNSSGTQYLATGGTGDVLTGVIGSFLGQGYSVENAAICGVYHHGLAGQLASKDKYRGTIASDVIDCIPRTFSIMNIS